MSDKKTIADAVAELDEAKVREILVRTLEADAKRRAAQRAYVANHKEARKAYSRARNAKQRALLARAKELGLDREASGDDDPSQTVQ